MTLKHSSKFTFIFMGLLILIALYMQYSINKSTEMLKESEINKAKQYAMKITDYIKKHSYPSLASCLDEHPEIRDNLNHILYSFQTEDFKNLFVLYKDKKNIFRFLLDGAEEDPVQYKTIFFPESKIFQTIYKSGEVKIIEQKGAVEEVWMSLLYPILRNTKVEGLLVIDLSKAFGEHITNFNSPLQDTIKILQFFVLISLFFLGLNAYNTYKLQKSMFKDTHTSAYTKLFRRNFFDEHTVENYNLIQVNIDHLNRFISSYGTEKSRSVIKEFVIYLEYLLPKNSYIIRNYDAEFLIVLPKSFSNFKVFAQSLFDNLNTKQYPIGNEVAILKVFICALIPPTGSTSFYEIEQVLDKKMLEIKNIGKYTFEIIDNISLTDIKYKNIEHIKKAIDNNRVTCVYQPIFHTKSKKISKYEALVRIIDEDNPKKLISPYYFLDSIKETVHYIQLSHIVLQNVFTILKTHPDVHLSFNIDISDLHNDEMMKIIRKELYTNRTLAHRLTFEILEHNEITDYAYIGVIFEELKSYGSKIAIDDFGSGYANFIYLSQMDIDIIKIDAVLIQALEGNNEKNKSIVRLINELATSQELEIVAEFVSTEEIYEILCELDVAYSQGYYLGMPKLWKEHFPSV